MAYKDRFDRIKETLEHGSEGFDWVRGFQGESEYMWEFFKDKITIRIGLDGRPDLKEWCQKIYDKYVPTEHKPRRKNGNLLKCESAARLESNMYAVAVCTLKKWLIRNYQLVEKKFECDARR